MLTKRVIPCMDVKDGRVVKGVNFVNLRDAGDPIELAQRYDEQKADEVIFLDITATSDGRANHDRHGFARKRRATPPLLRGRRVPQRCRHPHDDRRRRRQGVRELSGDRRPTLSPQLAAASADRRPCVRSMRNKSQAILTSGKSMLQEDARTRASMRSSGQPKLPSVALARSCSPVWIAMAAKMASTWRSRVR